LNIIQEGINRKFNKEMEALELEHQITLLGIQFKSSDAQVAILKAEQDKKRQSLLEAGATEQQIAEENAREINALTEKIAIAKIDAENKIAKDIINERQKGKEREIEFEKQKEIDLLKADLVAENKRLDVLISHITTDDDIILEQQIEDSKANIKKLGDAINKATGELHIEERKFSWIKLLGLEVKPEDEARVEAALSQAVAQIGTAINSITSSIFQEQQDAVQVQIDNNQKLVDSLNQRISDEEQALNQELALQKQGYASNVDGKKKEIASLIAERNKDMANQQSLHEQKKKLAKEQAAIELVEQEAAIVTAGAQVIKGFAGIPVVGLILGLAAAASLVAGFLAFKAKVRAAETLGEGGEVDGELHSNGGNKYVSMDGRSRIKEIERGEFIVKKKSTQKHRALIEAINKDNFDKLEFVDLIPLLKGTGVVLKDGVEKGIASEAVSLHKFQVNQISNMRLEKVEKSLSEIHETITDIGSKLLGKEERTSSSNAEVIKKNGNTIIVRK
jgi:hypothetical protein